MVSNIDIWKPRAELRDAEIPHYEHPDCFTIKMYHGGFIRNNNYIGGKFDYYDMVDKDKMSLIEIDGMVKGLNQTYVGSRIDYWYAIGSEDDALTKLTTDFDVSTMCCCVPEFRLVIIYLDHLDLHDDFPIDSDVYEDEISNCVFSQIGSNGVMIEELPDELRKKLLVVIKEFSDETMKKASLIEIPDKPRKIIPAIPTKKVTGVVIKDKEAIPTQLSITPDHNPKDKGKQKVEQDTGPKLEEFFDNELVDINVSNFLSRGRYKQYYEEECEDSSDKGNSDDEDYTPVFDGDDYDRYGVDDDWLDDMDGEFNESGEWIGADTGGSIVAMDFVDEEMQVEDNEEMFGAMESDEEAIGHEANSDDEKGSKDFPEFNPKTDMKNPQFSKGLKFATAKILRSAIRERAIQDGWEAIFIKSDKTRVRVICKADNCPFELFVSKMQHEDTLMVKTYVGEHTCARVFANSMVRTSYLTDKFMDQIKLNPNWAIDSLAQTMSASVKAKVSIQQAYRTKRAALKLLESSIKEQYARIRDYGDELKRVDPNTTIDIKCDFDNPGQVPIFKRMYICLGALKMGFRAGCRTVIGLDGCHLKSPYGGQLLTAVGLDANNTTWVVSYAMVEMESKDSWVWFLNLLVKDLNIRHEGAGWTFISDKQKGLLPAFDNVIPLADHRFCVRHLWTNFNKLFPGKVMKDQLWACAKATTMAYFTKEMVLMNQMEPNAYLWLTDPERPAKHWSRSHFNPNLKCDILLNNLCESFNAFILDARGKPIVSSFEEIRVKLMKRIHLRRDKMMSYGSAICPKPRDILEKNKVKAATDCIPSGSGSQKIEVESIGGSKYVVDLEAQTCACRRWDLSGIPCKHAVAAINFMRMKPEDFVHECYLKKTYMAIYSNTIKPLNGINLWSRSDEATILPPQYTRQPGRPKTKRIKDASEKADNMGPKLGKIQRSLKCSNCGVLGHNMKTCHRHLPPKTKKATDLNKKRKLNEDASSSQAQANSKRKSPSTKNELRQKAKQRAEKLKKKREDRKAAVTKRSNANVASSAKSQVGASSSKVVASAKVSSRSSSKIRENAKGEKK